MAETVDVRCPVGPRQLFVKLKLGEEFGSVVAGNLMEFTCSDCAKRIGRQRRCRVRVFHRFDFVGELVQTTVEDQWVCETGGWSSGP